MPNTADEIRSECASTFAANSDDCNKFVKGVTRRFFEPDLFQGADMNADAIIADMHSSADWTDLAKSHDQAIAEAKAGKFVVAGMTSAEIGGTNGHLAIIVGDDGEKSGKVIVPICYAGSLNVAARVQRQKVSRTFRATDAQEGKINYFSRATQTS